jgi:hypothetical protein
VQQHADARSIHRKIREARRVLGIAERRHREKQREMEALAHRRLGAVEARQYFERIWPDDPEVADNTHARRVRALMAENFEVEGDAVPAIAGTAWAAYNAVSRFTDWQRPVRGLTRERRDNSRLASIWLGDSARLKRVAWEHALDLTRPSARRTRWRTPARQLVPQS